MIGDKLLIQEGHIKAAQHLIELLLPQILQTQGRFIVTIAGESGSGKSEIAVTLSKALSERGIKSIVIQQDDYFVYPPKTNARMRRQDINHAGLSEVRLALLDQNLHDIMEGKNKIKKPLVIFDDDLITEETLRLNGVKATIVDGSYTTLLNNAHQHIFVDRTYLDTKEIRQRRAREKQDEFLEKVLEIEHKIISSHKPHVDIIVTKDYEVKKRSGNRKQGKA